MKELPGDSRFEGEGTPRALDGLVAGGNRAKGLNKANLRSTWILVSRNDEPVEDFFLDSPFGADAVAGGEDPVAWICRGMRADGTVRLGAVDFEVDRFASDVLASIERRGRR